MSDEKKAGELSEGNEALRHSRASLTQDSSLWPFVTAVLAESAQTISARSAAIFLHDERSQQMRTAIVLEHGQPVDFFDQDRFIELWEPFEVTHSPIWQELVAGKSYHWCDLTDEANLSLKWLIPWYRRLGLQGGLAVPLIFNGRPIGLAIFGCMFTDPPSADRLGFLKSLVYEAALAIQLVRMSGQARDAEMAQQEIRVAGEVHDNVAQYLAAISMHLAAAQSSIKSDTVKASKAIDRARELARLGMELARRTTLVLRPGRSEAAGTSQTLVDLIRDAGRKSNLICDFREVGQIPRTIGAETEKGLLQIAKEAINNALQHGKSRKLIAIVTWYADRVKLEIVDNGIGFDLDVIEEQSEGYGIQGMRECATQLGGTLEIVSCPGEGTRVQATLPMLNV
jgi:signal transduction histidine kinase